jgi:Glycosyl hydrolases family 6
MRWTSSLRRAGRLRIAACCVALLAALGAWHAAAGQARRALAPTVLKQNCREHAPARRTPKNPLMLAKAPGSNPLRGARFSVPGPFEGNAARAIAQLVGLDPDKLSNTESWRTFHRSLVSGSLHSMLADNHKLAQQVALLSTIAAQPQAQRVSSASEGGTPAGIFAQTEKIFCSVLPADPGTIPIFTTDFLHASLGNSPTTAQIHSYMPLFRKRVNAMAAAVDRRPAVILVELNALGASSAIAKSQALPAWEQALHYEITKFGSLPHTVVYVEGGYSDSNTVAYVANALEAIGVQHIQGFFTNDTHNNWTVDEDRRDAAIARRIGGTHFVVNTASNGRGPKLNPHPSTQGVENLCNPPGRGLGIRDTTHTGVAGADAYLWEVTPGNSSGCGGGPSGGTFWPAYAEGLAARANDQLGPHFPSKPY